MHSLHGNNHWRALQSRVHTKLFSAFVFCACRGLQAVVDGLRGDGPLVSVQLDIRNDHQPSPEPAAATAGTTLNLTPDPPVAASEGPMTGPLTKALSRFVCCCCLPMNVICSTQAVILAEPVPFTPVS